MPTDDHRPLYTAIPLWVIVVLVGGNLTVSSLLGLGDAEALYYAYSQNLALSYLDHPPLIGWWIRAVSEVLGDTVLALRTVSMVTSSTTVVFIGLAAGAAFGRRAVAPAATLLLAMPMFSIGSVAVAPDAPLIALWSVALWLLVHAAQGRFDRRPTSLFAAASVGAVIGLAFLSKYTGALLIVPAAWVMWQKRKVFGPRTLEFWLATAVAALLAIPVFVWNAHHGWAGVLHRLVWSQEGAGWSLRNAGALIGGQLLYVGPFLLALFVLAIAAHRRGEAASSVSKLLILTALATLVPTYTLVLWSPVAEPHWPAPGYLALIICAAGVLSRRSGLKLARWALGYGLSLLLITHLVVLTPILPRVLSKDSYEPRYDLANELRGWETVATRLRHVAGGRPVWAAHYTQCAQLTYALREQGDPPVRCVSREIDDFDLWHAPPVGGADGVVFVTDNRFEHNLGNLFEAAAVEELAPVVVERGGREVRRFELYAVSPIHGTLEVNQSRPDGFTR